MHVFHLKIFYQSQIAKNYPTKTLLSKSKLPKTALTLNYTIKTIQLKNFLVNHFYVKYYPAWICSDSSMEKSRAFH